MRKKVYDIRNNTIEVVEARRADSSGTGSGGGSGNSGSGSSYDDSESNPLHSRTSGSNGQNNFDANPFAQQPSTGLLEMTPIPNLTMPRVFNGDYRQLPITTDDD